MLRGHPLVERECRLVPGAAARAPDLDGLQPPLGPIPAQDRFGTADVESTVAPGARAAPLATAQRLRDTLPHLLDENLGPCWAGGLAHLSGHRPGTPYGAGSFARRSASAFFSSRRRMNPPTTENTSAPSWSNPLKMPSGWPEESASLIMGSKMDSARSCVKGGPLGVTPAVPVGGFPYSSLGSSGDRSPSGSSVGRDAGRAPAGRRGCEMGRCRGPPFGQPRQAVTVALPKNGGKTKQHYTAVAQENVQEAITGVRATPGVSDAAKSAFEFLILTATRTTEVLGATWDEIDLEAGGWTIPASRMKAKREHRVLLSATALAVIAHVPALRTPTS